MVLEVGESSIGELTYPIAIPNGDYYILACRAEYVIILEKETALMKLVSEGYMTTHNCVIVTGKGYPDLAIRIFLRKLVQKRPDLPMFAITDADPHGFQILCCYTFGSNKRLGQNLNLALPTIHWLGIHFSDFCEE